jgi:hypothetical protein
VDIGRIRIPEEYLRFEMQKPNMLEEFNKKVFTLIDLSREEQRLG